MKLLIVESPNKVKKIKSILGNGWDVAASVGHIRDLPIKELGVGQDYRLTYEYNERGEGVVDGLRPRIARAEVVYLATDPDREGEAIAWHLKEALKLGSYQRVTFDAITEPVIRKALTSPRQLDMDLVHAQEARRGTDRLVGYKVSPALSRQTGIASLSAGRVQTVAVRLVVERQREIAAFRETKHFGAEAIFDDGAWTAQWDTKPYLAEGQEYVLDAELAARAAQCKDFQVTASETKPARRAPSPPFTTATLLQAASVALHLKPDQTAQLAQKLFEAGLITYHRTDSQNFSAEALEEIRRYATAQNLPLPAQPRRWKSKESAQEAHEAIRPTHLDQRVAGEDDEQKRLYALIWTRAVASQLADAEYSVNVLALSSESDGQAFTFRATGRTLLKPGWRLLTAKDAAEDADLADPDDEDKRADENVKVPALAIGTPVTATETRILNKQTRPPNGYTQAFLIKKLEHEGIGRPSTYPLILKNIISRGYLNDTKKILSATELGMLLIDSVVGQFAFAEYDYTRQLEQQLDDIASGKNKYFPVVSQLDLQLELELRRLHVARRPDLAADRPIAAAGAGGPAPVAGFPCPRCKQGAVRRPRGQEFYSCNRYKEGCTYKVNIKIAGKSLTEKQIETLITKGRTSVLKGFHAKSGSRFDAALTCTAETSWQTKFEFANKNRH